MNAVYTQLLFLLIILSGCSLFNKESRSEIVARVENEILTRQELDAQIGPEASAERRKEYIRRWMHRELLYQAAINEKLHKNKELKEKIEESERNLLSMAYLSRQVEPENSSVTEIDIQTYYNSHKSEFVRNDDVIRYAVMELNTLKGAWSLRQGLNENNFYQVSRQYSKQKVVKPEEIDFVSKGNLPKELQNKLFEIKEGGITTPMKMGESVFLYLILQKGAKGSLATLDEVYQEVKSKVVTARYQAQVDRTVEALREQANCSVNSEFINDQKKKQISLRGKRNE